jgi:hypothetical protein
VHFGKTKHGFFGFALCLCGVGLLCLGVFSRPASSHDIITTNLTYSRDIARIFANHCLACHGTGSSVPLTTYEEARPWAVAIKEQVLSRSMPPWGAVKGFGELSPDRGLSQEDILIISAWVVGGAPAGNPGLLPKAQDAHPLPPAPVMKDAVTIDTRAALKEKIRVTGLRPLQDSTVESSRILARFPDGRIEPLLWLYHFDPKYRHDFTFRRPLDMPPGTVVESSAPLRFALETGAASSAQAGS